MVIRFLKASKGDCFLITFKDNENISRNILIDGGVNNTYFEAANNRDGELKIEIDRIKQDKQKIDLLILTHIDNDHICGLLKWFEMDKNAHEIVEKVWFNSGKLIAEYFKEPENKDLDIGLKIFSTAYTGVTEALDFEKYLLTHKIWERKIVKEGTEINQNGASIKVLSPNDDQLNKLLKEYKRETGDSTYTSGISKDWNITLKELIEDEESNYQEPNDSSPKNQSSISFILNVEKKNFLFLADAPSNQIIKALNDMGHNRENPLVVEFMKVSHHGSKNNTCNELLQAVKTNHYLISTDSSSHGHPDKRTLARIVRFNPNVSFYFNYEHVKNNVISKQDYDDFEQLKAYSIKELTYYDE